MKMHIKTFVGICFIYFLQASNAEKTILERLETLERRDSEHVAHMKASDAVYVKSVRQLEQKVRDLIYQFKEKDSIISKLSAKFTKLESRVKELEKVVKRREDVVNVSEKDQKFNRLDDRYSSSPDANTTTNVQTTFSNDKDLHTLKRGPVRRIRQTEIVAFYATNSYYTQRGLGPNQNIVFETVHLDSAAAYHKLHGIFIAPRAGLYIFSASILSTADHKPLYTVLVKNGSRLAQMMSFGDGRYGSEGSVTVITEVNVGDEIWVKLDKCCTGSMYGGEYSSFTGAMLFAY